MKIITHKNTSTLGDFANTLPFISEFSKKNGPVHLSLPKSYEHYNGLKELLEYQDCIKIVDFDDLDGDIDIQSHSSDIEQTPVRSYYTANKLGYQIDQNFILKFKDIQIPEDILTKNIVVDREKTKIIFKNELFFDKNQYYWLDYNNCITYNLNVCLKTKGIIYSTFTGFPILLNLSNIKQKLIYFDESPDFPLSNVKRSFEEHFFDNRETQLLYYKDIS